MWEHMLDTARRAVAWGRSMDEVESMTPRQHAAMTQAYEELYRAQRRAEKRNR
jgi:hypothetical protein